jgi:hypothetical protein
MRVQLISVWRILQYPIGLGAAWFVSVFTGLMLLSLQADLFFTHSLVGFLGVFVGSLFFLPASRLIGSIFLSLIGTAFFYLRFVWYDVGRDSVPDGWVRLAYICAGAVVAIVSHLFWIRFSRRGTPNKDA